MFDRMLEAILQFAERDTEDDWRRFLVPYLCSVPQIAFVWPLNSEKDKIKKLDAQNDRSGQITLEGVPPKRGIPKPTA
jgi:hypothetical protein